MQTRIEGDAVWISLGDGLETVIDAEDLPLVAPYKWHATPDCPWTRYATAPVPGGQLRMHRLITGLPDGVLVDHRDRNGLNNRRYNLRPATGSQNGGNRRANQDPNMWSRFKGVRYRVTSKNGTYIRD